MTTFTLRVCLHVSSPLRVNGPLRGHCMYTIMPPSAEWGGDIRRSYWPSVYPSVSLSHAGPWLLKNT